MAGHLTPADLDLVLDRGVALILGGIAGVDYGPKGYFMTNRHRRPLITDRENPRGLQVRLRWRPSLVWEPVPLDRLSELKDTPQQNVY